MNYLKNLQHLKNNGNSVTVTVTVAGASCPDLSKHVSTLPLRHLCVRYKQYLLFRTDIHTYKDTNPRLLCCLMCWVQITIFMRSMKFCTGLTLLEF